MDDEGRWTVYRLLDVSVGAGGIVCKNARSIGLRAVASAALGMV